MLLGDTICDIPNNFDYSWIGVKKVDKQEICNYCIAMHSENKLIDLIDKPYHDVNSNMALIGIYYFKNPNLLTEVLNDEIEKQQGEYQLSSYILKYNEIEKITCESINEWHDIGSLEQYLSANKQSFNCRFFNTLNLDEYGVLHKKSINKKISSEINWYKSITNTDFGKVTPKFYEKEIGTNEYAIEYYDYLTLSEYLIYYPINEKNKRIMFKSVFEKLFNISSLVSSVS